MVVAPAAPLSQPMLARSGQIPATEAGSRLSASARVRRQMPAYVVALILEMLDEEAFDRYRANVAEIVERNGGEYLAATDQTESLEGVLHPFRTAIVEFPSWEQARAWFDADDYSDLRELIPGGGANRVPARCRRLDEGSNPFSSAAQGSSPGRVSLWVRDEPGESRKGGGPPPLTPGSSHGSQVERALPRKPTDRH
jgi:uncharacterized protein (DUF1330 family)